MKQKSFISGLVLSISVLVIGCNNAKRIENNIVPQQVPAAPGVPMVVHPQPNAHYTVVKHDTLWGIAGKSTIYGDSFQWPMIFKANRDKIQDPDLIYPKQDLEIKKEPSSDEVAKA